METLIVSGQIPPARFRFSHRASPVRTSQSLRFHRRFVVSANLTTEPVSESPNRMFILGMGYLSTYVSDEFKNKGWDVHGTVNSYEEKEKLEGKGFENVHVFSKLKPELSTLNAMRGCTHLLVSVSGLVGTIGNASLLQEELLRSVFAGGNLKWLCFLSRISVYGDHGDEWIDEDSTTKSEDKSDKIKLVAEEKWLKLGNDLGLSSFVFRLGSVYGPGASALDRIIREGPLTDTQMMKVSGKYTSRIHVEDICQALEASIVKPTDRHLYNIVDDKPSSGEEMIVYAQNLVDEKWPGRMRRDPFPEYYIHMGTKMAGLRVSNARMKNELGVSLRYPDYVSGLKSMLDKMEDPFKNHPSFSVY